MKHITQTLFILGIISSTVIMIGCSSSGDDSSAKAASEEVALQISSPNFQEIRPKKRIPKENTCWGENVSPPLNWSGEPAATKSFALIAEDIDAEDLPWVHWILWNIPSTVTELPEGIPTSTDILPDNTTQGINDFKTMGYDGPCPQQIEINYYDAFGGKVKDSNKPHRYVFTIFALDSEITLDPGSTKKQLVKAMEGLILAQAETTGKFQIAPTTERAKEAGHSHIGVGGRGDIHNTSTPATSTSK